ncbi:MAG: CmpA/NrtA family ABC transporter substrate-binding protein [Minwuia sp.]|uniref:CmpA/NrtA family ABC transporter substrate-binding protein n=1 Tax=Minwuia sp. TaxID=2493630 RepID=UPI003A88497B
MTPTQKGTGTGLEPVRAGFVPLADSAPLIVAARRGFAAAEGIDLILSRQPSWASVRDRINVGHLDVAQMLAGMPIASTLGIAHVTVPMIAPFAFGRGGNAIVLSRRLTRELEATGIAWRDGSMEAASAFAALAHRRSAADEAPPVLGMVFPFSSHNFELRYWLAAAGSDPDSDARLVVIPPPMMVDSLRAGQIDGFCAGEPWASLAVDSGLASIVAVKQDIWARAPEKVLGVTTAWASENPGLLQRLLRSLKRAGDWCNNPDNLDDLSSLLSSEEFVGAPRRILRRALAGQLVLHPDMAMRHVPDFLCLGGNDVNYPTREGALWIYSQMVRWDQTPYDARDAERAGDTYRPDLLAAALGEEAPAEAGRVEGFMDRLAFNPADLPGYLQTLNAGSA